MNGYDTVFADAKNAIPAGDFLTVFYNSSASLSRKACSPNVLILKNIACEPPEVIALR